MFWVGCRGIWRTWKRIDRVSGIPPNAMIKIDLEVLSWKVVEDITADKMVTKKIIKQGEGYDMPNDGATVLSKAPSTLNHLHWVWHFVCGQSVCA